MAVRVADTIKPFNDGDFPIVEAIDVITSSGVKLQIVLDNLIDDSNSSNTSTYSSNKILALIHAIETGLKIEIVEELPLEDIDEHTIYLLPKEDETENDIYDEYMYVQGAWERIGSTRIDLSNYYTKDEVDALLDGKVDIVVGKGLSTNDFTDALKEKLENISSKAELTADMTTSVSVGGIDSGATYEEGTPLETVIRDMLEPTLYPTFVPPSATMTATGSKLLETGATLETTFTIVFNRGSITPAYGTSGYRSGFAEEYTLDGVTQSGNSFTKTISSDKTNYVGSVSYLEGEQPKDSKGGDYDAPYPSGSVNTNAINYEFVDAIWANTSSITSVAKLALVSKSAKVKEFTFPAQTVANPEVFDIPASWNVIAVEVLNTLSNQWEDCSREFTTSSTTHENASGDSVNYVRYTDNRGYAAASRKIRVKWN